MNKINKNLSLFTMIAATCILQGAPEAPQPNTVQKIIIHEPQPSRIKRIFMYTALATGGAVVLDARFLGGRFLWKPLKRRLFPELYAQLDTIENGIQDNGRVINANSKQLNALTEQAGRIEDKVDSNGDLLESVQGGVSDNGTKIAANGTTITKIAAALTTVTTQAENNGAALQAQGETLGRLEEGQHTLHAGQQKILQLLKPANQEAPRINTKTLSFTTQVPEAPSSQKVSSSGNID